MAESRRRNLHLGHHAVDTDIAELGALLRSHLGQDGASGHWGGDTWWAYVHPPSLPVFDAVVAAFGRSMVITAGWECRARAVDGTQRFSSDRAAVVLHRGVRCGYVAVQHTSDLDDGLTTLQRVFWQLPVGKVTPIAEVSTLPATAWPSLSGVIPTAWHCPFCAGDQMTEGEGTDDSEEGQCVGCRAALDVHYF